MISGDILFNNENQLSFMELKHLDETEKIKYKYHYMDKNKNLIFRYDNAQHHHDIETFPHHKHTTKNIENSKEPELKNVLNEIHDKYST